MDQLALTKTEVKEVPSQMGVVLILYFGNRYFQAYFKDANDAYRIQDDLRKFLTFVP